jgi:lysophospholipid acyltransferase (LPLAT)-like uncharacterized protein
VDPPRPSLGKRLLGGPFARAAVGALSRAYRAVFYGGSRLLVDPGLRRLVRSREPVVFVCWHQDFVWTVGWLSRFCRRRRSHVLASASRDGGLAAASAEALGFREAVRGSSAARGAVALRRLESIATGNRPTSVVVVGDGPRPPARELKPGALHLAREAGLPVWLVRTAFAPPRRLLRSWAQFDFPPPWRAGVVVADGPIEVPAGLDRDGLERLRAALQARLDRLAERADALAAQRLR